MDKTLQSLTKYRVTRWIMGQLSQWLCHISNSFYLEIYSLIETSNQCYSAVINKLHKIILLEQHCYRLHPVILQGGINLCPLWPQKGRGTHLSNIATDFIQQFSKVALIHISCDHKTVEFFLSNVGRVVSKFGSFLRESGVNECCLCLKRALA